MLLKDIPLPVRLVLFVVGAIGIYFGVMSFSACGQAGGQCAPQLVLLLVSMGLVFFFVPVRRKEA